MRILGIDPGIAIVGYGVIESQGSRLKHIENGVLTTPAGMPLPQRLEQVYNGMKKLLMLFQPEAIAFEELFFAKNAKTAITVGQARGVALLAAAQESEQLFEYTPLQIKQGVVGYGRAEKNQVQQMVKVLLNLPDIPKPDDAADALAVAICHAHSANSQQLFKIK
ncbi:crossover junction endodeoxyribonuclease RuvC [Christensenellaceae bacterium NSJ-44]|uniref:Crossover junction endodeoxyribonuclease RuvC n=1 Tax=Luoshenia tenuis TaxID=2763654 RepID=A0A926D254_9FIRM|nr:MULTISPECIES: crossover junction endodeoxyribonuclease RuvC [Clostridia]MBC8530101.1 crossover junction endodeoxyribonuclease RuvC [Luoshenia tenuis]SCJ73635.1 Crossover junction endodeoxyribonuclease RuvC [uncultured Clostridium sp.]